jgi:dihydrofolate reductase
MSLDGYIAGPNDRPDNPGGDGFLRLHEWGLAPDGQGFRTEGPGGEMMNAVNSTGAVLSGRRTAEQAGHWRGHHHGDGIRIFVISSRPAPREAEQYPLITYVNDTIENAMAMAKEAAGDREVLVHGGYTATKALEAGVLDELQIHQIPVLFGSGRRLFDTLPKRLELDIVRVVDTPEATHLRYRVRY